MAALEEEDIGLADQNQTRVCGVWPHNAHPFSIVSQGSTMVENL